MSLPPARDIALWWYEYPKNFDQGGMIAAALGAGAAYYFYGSPLDAYQFGNYQQLAMGYATGAAVSTVAIVAMERAEGVSQYIPKK